MSPRENAVFHASKLSEAEYWKAYGPVNVPEITVRVRCTNKMHTIRLRQDGRLNLLDHDLAGSDDKFLVAEALTGKVCRCREIREAWEQSCKLGLAKHSAGILPQQLRPICQFLAERSKLRAIAKYVSRVTAEDKLRVVHRSIPRLVRQCFERKWNHYAFDDHKCICGLRIHVTSNNRLAPHVDSRWPDSTSSYVHWRVRKQSIPSRSLCYIHDIMLSYDWFRKVYKKGLMYIDGAIVVDIFDQDQVVWRYPQNQDYNRVPVLVLSPADERQACLVEDSARSSGYRLEWYPFWKFRKFSREVAKHEAKS